MKKFYYFFLILIAGITTAIAVMAFTGPGARTPGVGNPDFWIKSGNDIYYNPVGSGNIGIGTINPGQKLSVVGVIESTSGGFRFPDSTTQTTAATGGLGGGGTVNYVGKFTDTGTIGNSLIFDNGTNVGIGDTNPVTRLEIADANKSLWEFGNLYIRTNNAQAAGIGGSLFFGGIYTGSADTSWASIAGQKENGTDGNFSAYLQFGTRANSDGAITERMRITSAGNVGIGTTGPGARMEIKHNTVAAPETSGSSRTGAVTRFFSKTSYFALDIGEYGASPYSYWLQASDPADLSTNVPIVFNPNGGNVGIGTTAPGYKLDVQGGQINASGGLCINTDCKTAWSQVASKSLSGFNGYNVDTVYQALTDGFVIVITHHYAGGVTQILSDLTNPPTTTRAKSSTGSGTTEFGTTLTVPIRKNDYWKVTNTADPATVYWVGLN